MAAIWLVYGIGLKGREPSWQPKEVVVGATFEKQPPRPSSYPVPPKDGTDGRRSRSHATSPAGGCCPRTIRAVAGRSPPPTTPSSTRPRSSTRRATTVPSTCPPRGVGHWRRALPEDLRRARLHRLLPQAPLRDRRSEANGEDEDRAGQGTARRLSSTKRNRRATSCSSVISGRGASRRGSSLLGSTLIFHAPVLSHSTGETSDVTRAPPERRLDDPGAGLSHGRPSPRTARTPLNPVVNPRPYLKEP